MAMTREQARLIAMRMREAKPELAGMNLDTLIAKIMVNADLPDPSAPVMTPGGMSRETVFDGVDTAIMAPPPKMVTPASPAPMRAGVPVMAPRPEAKPVPQPAVGGPLERARAVAPTEDGEEPEQGGSRYRSPFRLAAQAAEAELRALSDEADRVQEEGKELTPESKLKLKMATDKYVSLETRAIADEAVQLDPERAALLARQEGRIKADQERVAREEKEAPWDAILRGGMALMSPRKGANFLAALGEGLGAGLDTYEAAKARAVEQRARLGEKADEVVAQRMDALEKARSAARQAIESGEQFNERTLRLANLTDEALVGEATRPFRISAAESAASKAATEARYAPALAESEVRVRNAQAANYLSEANGGPGGPGGPKKITATANQDLKQLEKAENEAVKEMTKARRDWVAAGKPESGEELDAMRDATTAMQSAMAARRGYLERIGLPYTEKNIPAKKAYRQEFGLEPKPGARKPAAASGRPAGVGPDWTLQTDAKGRRAWVSPDGKRYKEVR